MSGAGRLPAGCGWRRSSVRAGVGAQRVPAEGGRSVKKRFVHMSDGLGQGRLSVLLCLTVCFAVGALAGCFFAGVLGGETQRHLSAYLGDYFAVLRDGEPVAPSLFSAAWELCRWPLLVFVLGFTALGAVGVPVVFLVRGFLLSYSVAVFVRLFGVAGLAAAAAVFGVCAVFVLPALFVLGADAMGGAMALAAAFWGEGKRPAVFGRGRLLRAGGCGLLLAAGAGVQLWLTPALLRAAAGLFA